MKNLLIVALGIAKCLGNFIIGGVLIFILFMLIQLISYRVFNYNLYKEIMKKLF